MKSRYVFLLLTVLIFGNSFTARASARHNSTSCLAQGKLRRTLVEDYILPSVSILALTGPYGLAGYWTMSASKRLGKEIADKVFMIPDGSLQRTVALDGKVFCNDLFKRAVVGVDPGAGLPLIYIPRRQNLRGQFEYYTLHLPWLTHIREQGSRSQILFDAANRGLSFEEFVRAIKMAIDEFIKISSPDTAKKITPNECLALQDVHSLIGSKISDAAYFFYDAAIALTHDPGTAAIASTYFTTSWIICGLTRMFGDITTKNIGLERKPYDAIMRTTVGLVMSSALQPSIIEFMNTTANEFGYAAAIKNRLNELAYTAGSKGPFGWDGITALITGILMWWRIRARAIPATGSQANLAPNGGASPVAHPHAE